MTTYQTLYGDTLDYNTRSFQVGLRMTTTYQAPTGETLAYNNRAMWQRHHGTRFWWLSVGNKQPYCHAVIDDFGTLIPVPWSHT